MTWHASSSPSRSTAPGPSCGGSPITKADRPAPERGGSRPEEWFRSWFGDDYLWLYPHRDQKEAAAGVRLHLAASGRPGGRTLDLACGAGRHLLELRRAGIEAVGLDLSLRLLRRAHAHSSPPFQLVQADMRWMPFADGSFAAVTSFFTSFGYFAARADDASVAREIRRVMTTGGAFTLDYLNARRVRAELVPEESTEMEGRAVHITRHIEDDVVVKRIMMYEEAESEPRRYSERVRLYSADELEGLLAGAGLVSRHRFGDYAGRSFSESSDRLVLVGTAE